MLHQTRPSPQPSLLRAVAVDSCASRARMQSTHITIPCLWEGRDIFLKEPLSSDDKPLHFSACISYSQDAFPLFFGCECSSFIRTCTSAFRHTCKASTHGHGVSTQDMAHSLVPIHGHVSSPICQIGAHTGNTDKNEIIRALPVVHSLKEHTVSCAEGSGSNNCTQYPTAVTPSPSPDTVSAFFPGSSVQRCRLPPVPPQLLSHAHSRLLCPFLLTTPF